jgi:hypothetical protein
LPETRLSRRTLLAGVAGLGATPLIGSCSAPDRGQGRLSPPEPDAPIRDQVVASIAMLISTYQATAERHPTLTERLAPLAAEHHAHLAALGAPAATATPATPAATATAAPSLVPVAPVVSADPRRAVRALVTAESRAAADRVGVAVAATSPDLARLLAAIGACEATHAALLREGR